VAAVRILAAAGAALGLVAGAPSWRPIAHVPGIVDVAGPRVDGRLVLSTHTGLYHLRPGGSPVPFAAQGYAGAAGEPYIALVTRPARQSAGCSFARNDVFALDPGSTPGVVRIAANGQATRLADLASGVFPSGIAYDTTGRFGSRLLVTGVVNNTTTLYAIDCTGAVATVTEGAPRVEGGIVVAPRRFGHFGGDLIAADENTGTLYAFGPRGAVAHVADSGVAAGGDIGIEALGFVPVLTGRAGAYVADLGAPGSPTEGTDSLLSLARGDLVRSGVRPGDLLAVSEGGAATVAVRCARACTVREVAAGPAATHGEGHVAFG
jgi:hypothetical protein